MFVLGRPGRKAGHNRHAQTLLLSCQAQTSLSHVALLAMPGVQYSARLSHKIAHQILRPLLRGNGTTWGMAPAAANKDLGERKATAGRMQPSF